MIQIHYDLSAGIKPAPPLKRRYAGVMGEVNGVSVAFTVPAVYADDAYRKRVEFMDVTGKLFTTDEVAYNELLMQSGTTLWLTLPWQWTVYGGTGFIRMVFYKTDDSDAVTPLEFTPQFPLYFDTTEEANDKVERRSLAQLIVDGHGAVKNAATASSNANLAAGEALTAADKADLAAEDAHGAANDAQAVAEDIVERLEAGEFNGPQGVSVQYVNIDPGTQHLIITLSNGKVIDAGELPKGEQGPQGEQGPRGEQGPQGERGYTGKDGADGVSPVVTVTEITGGHRVTITDAEGTKTFDVMDGEDGEGGGTKEVYVQTEEPTDAPDGSIWINPDGESPESGGVTDAVQYTEQTLTEAQKAQARTNIGAQPAGNYVTQENLPTVPTALPNPNALTFTGAVEGAYDGSKPLTVNIPEGGGGGGCSWEHICDITTTEEVATIEVTENSAGVSLSELKYNEIWLLSKMVGVSSNTGAWWKCIGTTDIARSAQGAVSISTTTTKQMSMYFFIRGNKPYWTDSSGIDPYDMNGGNDLWIANFLDYYNADHFVSLTIQGTVTTKDLIGVDSEIRILGRRV